MAPLPRLELAYPAISRRRRYSIAAAVLAASLLVAWAAGATDRAQDPSSVEAITCDEYLPMHADLSIS
jgi:hypothetical protein